MVERLLTSAVADMAVPVRRTVLESMKQMSDLDSYLAQADWLATFTSCPNTFGTAAVTVAAVAAAMTTALTAALTAAVTAAQLLSLSGGFVQEGRSWLSRLSCYRV